MFRNPPLRICRRRCVGLAWLLLIFGNAVFAQSDNWFARPWQTDDGLPDNIIMGVGQAPDGFLWVTTERSLMRFDGVRFQEFSPFNILGLADHNIRCLVVGKDGKVWLGLDNGVVVSIEAKSARVFGPKEGMPEVRVRTMVEDGEGAVWMNYPNRGGVVRIKDGKVTSFDTREGLPATDACRLAVDGKGELWFTKARSLGVFRGDRFETLIRLGEHAVTIGGARAGGVWITTTTRLLKYAEGGEAEVKGTLPQRGATQGVVLEDRAGGVWVANSVGNGLFRFNGREFETVPVSHPLINCLAEDREGNVWAATGGGGLNRLRPRTLELLNKPSGRPFPSVRAVCQDGDGSLWVATGDGVLLRQQKEKWMEVTSATNWPGGRADCIAADRSGGVWIGTRYNGLYLFQHDEFTVWNAKSGFTNEFIRSMFATPNGDLWITTDLPNQLFRMREGKLQRFEPPPGVRIVRAGAEDPQGNVWMGSVDGRILRITESCAVDVTTNDLGRLLPVRSMHAADDGSLWIGYSGWGVGRLKNGEYARLTTAQGLNDNFISQIISDDKGGLWLAGTHGLFRVSLEEMNAVAEGRSKRVRSVLYGQAEGVPNLEAYYDSFPDAIRGRDGRLIIGTRAGLAVVTPENIKDNPEPPPVLIESVVVDGKTVALYDSQSPLLSQLATNALNLRTETGGLRLPPGLHKVEFKFTALSYTAPQNMEFQFRLDGVDEDWNKGNAERMASYSRLPAGDYRFRVVACNNSGVWNDSGAVIALTVAPFLWQTWWFRVSALAAFTLCVIAIVRYVSYRRFQGQLRAMEQQAAVERERMRIARDIHDDLGDRLTTVAMLSGLALRNRNGNNADAKRLEQISSTARQATDALDEIVWAVNPRNDVLPNVVDYVGQFAVEFLRTANIQCRLDLPDHPPLHPVSAEARHNVFLAVKEALNNVVRHAGASEVKLSISAGENSGRVVVEDNGRGFAAMPTANGADGLQNMRQRMNEIGGHFEVESRPGKGTRITLEFPWLNKN